MSCLDPTETVNFSPNGTNDDQSVSWLIVIFWGWVNPSYIAAIHNYMCVCIYIYIHYTYIYLSIYILYIHCVSLLVQNLSESMPRASAPMLVKKRPLFIDSFTWHFTSIHPGREISDVLLRQTPLKCCLKSHNSLASNV